MTPILLHSNFNAVSHQKLICQQAKQWTNEYIQQSHNNQTTETLIDLLLLSYQVVDISCTMILAKLQLQEEILYIKTPSPLDSWQEHMQTELNDTSLLEEAVTTIKQSQETLHEICQKFKLLASQLVHINPEPTQKLIAAIKTNLLIWGSYQTEIPNEFKQVQASFNQSVEQVHDITELLTKISQTPENLTHLKKAINFFSSTYKSIDLSINAFIQMKKNCIIKLHNFFTIFFQTYYCTIYENILVEDIALLRLHSTDDHKVPAASSFF